MRVFYYIHLVTSVILGLPIFIFAGTFAGLSFLIGSVVIGLSTFGTQVVWAKILRKNSVASSLAIIVLKYTLLATVLYLIANSPLFEPLWFGLGASLIIISASVFGLRKKNGSSF